jgi:hypothetical protein
MKMSLEKIAEKVGSILDKRNINNIPCEVGLILDGSGSMSSDYNNGTVQEVVERVLAIAMKVDRDKKVDSWIFADNFRANETVTMENIAGYVDKYAIKNWSFGGTSYSPVLKAAIDSFFPAKGLFSVFKKKLDAPVLLIFITDGDANDNSKTNEVIKEATKKNVYIQLLGIGTGSSFSYLKETAEKYDNVGFLPIKNVSNIPEEDLFDGLLSDDFATWVKKFK